MEKRSQEGYLMEVNKCTDSRGKFSENSGWSMLTLRLMSQHLPSRKPDYESCELEMVRKKWWTRKFSVVSIVHGKWNRSIKAHAYWEWHAITPDRSLLRTAANVLQAPSHLYHGGSEAHSHHALPHIGQSSSHCLIDAFHAVRACP